MSKRLRGLFTAVVLIFRADRARALGMFGLTLIEAGGGVLFAFWLKYIVDGALRADGRTAMTGVIGMFVSIAARQAANWFSFHVGSTLAERTSGLIDRELIELTAKIPGMEHHERPDYLLEMDLLRQNRQMLDNVVGGLLTNFSVGIQIAGTVALLATIHPALVLLPLFGIPSVLIGAKAVQIDRKAQEETAEPHRTANHLFDLATTSGPAKEVRIFSLQSELRSRFGELEKSVDRVRRKAAFKEAALTTVGWFSFAVGYIGAMAFVVYRAVQAEATPGEVVMAFNLGAQVNQQVTQAVGGTTWFLRILQTIGRYLWLKDYAESARKVPSHPIAVPDRFVRGIELRDITFTYPGTETKVISDVNLFFPAGRTLAIVGENGAGKTTLVKLLCRFYDPSSGSILIDGNDLGLIDIEGWRSRISSGFQDFSKFEFLARETVGVGDLPRIEDVPAVEQALERANASDVTVSLPDGIETQLGKLFEGGAELSIGQWQKLALSRAMMRDPLLLILDEPTSSLDATAEHALFERFATASRRAAELTGAITILVSHRFSTVRMADLIVVIDGGRVVESGSHSELMASRGMYSELYELQARSYR